MKRKICFVALLILSTISGYAQQLSGDVFYQEVNWSPDGRSLSFTTYRKLDPAKNEIKADVWIIKSDGTGLRQIAENARWTSWAKDGKHILFSRQSEDKKSAQIYSAKIDGSGLMRLTNNVNRDSHPAASPDGKRIAFSSTVKGEKTQIYVMNSDGSNVKKLTVNPAVGCINPAWSPDGKKILYYAEKGDNKDQIWTMNADGSSQTLLTNNIGHNIYPGWLPNGREIIFNSDREGDKKAIYKMNADGTNVQRMKEIKSFYARVSPDGKKIAFIAGDFPKTEIFIGNADGSKAEKILIQ